jgi:hypothetical protein
MIWMILGIILGWILGRHIIGDLFTRIIFSLLGLVLGIAISMGFGALPVEKVYKLTGQEYLYALQDKTGVSEGSFFLGCGSIDSKEYYYYYKKVSENSFKMGKIETEDALVIEDDNETPRIETYMQRWKNENWYWLGIPAKEKIKVYIPKNSIVSKYKLDLN